VLRRPCGNRRSAPGGIPRCIRSVGDGANNLRFECAVNVAARFFFPRPLHETIAQRRRIYKTSKPDNDKLLRAVLDPLTKMGLLADDALVVSFNGGGKFYVPYRDSASIALAEIPRVELTITALEN
jgi:Holliday junction resolvase RusA-like endonuclease